MDKKAKSALIIGVAMVGLLGITYWLMKGKKGNAQTTPALLTPSQESCLKFPLGRGSGYGDRACEKPAVMLIQTWLNNQDPTGRNKTWVDGMFGEDTEAMLYGYMFTYVVSKSLYEDIKRELSTVTTLEMIPQPMA